MYSDWQEPAQPLILTLLSHVICSLDTLLNPGKLTYIKRVDNLHVSWCITKSAIFHVSCECTGIIRNIIIAKTEIIFFYKKT